MLELDCHTLKCAMCRDSYATHQLVESAGNALYDETVNVCSNAECWKNAINENWPGQDRVLIYDDLDPEGFVMELLENAYS